MTPTLPRPCRSLGTALLLLLLAGCAAKHVMNNQVEGTVKLDGTPLPNVVVQFVPDVTVGEQPPGASGYTDGQGHFSLTCDNKKPGAILGKYRVTVLPGRGGTAGGDDRDAPRGGKATAYVPPVYTQAAKTPLRVDVTLDQHTYDLTLTRNAR
jgi:hypothetical protein